jgi:hypothetical protein
MQSEGSPKPLTPALSHPMGEGESSSGFRLFEGGRLRDHREKYSGKAIAVPLSHRMGEGLGVRVS